MQVDWKVDMIIKSTTLEAKVMGSFWMMINPYIKKVVRKATYKIYSG